MSYEIVPLTIVEAGDFIHSVHRTHPLRPPGAKFCIGVKVDGKLVGVAVAGRPSARAYNGLRILEVTRTATDGTYNANSALYGAVWRAAKAMGYLGCITYTQEGESGASLRAAGWVLTAVLPPRAGWDQASKKRIREDRGNGNVKRYRWEIKASSAGLLAVDKDENAA